NILEDASKSSTLSNEDRFWALDALTFWDTQDRLYEQVLNRIDQMEELDRKGNLRTKAKIALVMKQMIAAGFTGNLKGIESAYSAAVELVENDRNFIRIVSYNRAYAYYHASDYSKVKSIIDALITEYYNHLNLTPSDVTAKGADHILPIVSKIPTWQDDLKRLADCLDLLASAKKQLGYKLDMEQIHALKFYTMCQAIPSAIRVGLNVVDQLMRVNPKEARNIIENSILPIVQLPEFVKYQFQVRLQYAVVLASNGELEAARLETEKNRANAVSQKQKEELERQVLIINRLAGNAGKKANLTLSKSNYINKKRNISIPKPSPAPAQSKKIGRNDPCYCGSGIKYKKCHGS
ncbi:SEC-C metal-binding domain-containing protein, partial [Chryseosolibacter indicus]